MLADANIPAASDAFGRFGAVRLLAGRDLTRDSVAGADVLLVRSVTPVDAALVEGTAVRFVGTATAGVDHVDRAALARLGIAFASAPGSNATSVVEYVLAALLGLAEAEGHDLMGATLGVVGAGAVGGRLVPRARALGLEVVVCDPPRAAAGHTDHDYRLLGEVLDRADIVTLHTPLTGPDGSPWPTHGLIGARELAAMKPGAWLVNAARGPVVDGPAVLAARRSRRLGALVLDCWPGEPAPDPALVDAADIATPHIAGYSAEGKLNGTEMIESALRAWVARQGAGGVPPWAGPPPPPAREVGSATVGLPGPRANGLERTRWLARLGRGAYAVWDDDHRFRTAMAAAGPDAAARAVAFAELRRTYPTRHENAAFVVRGSVPPDLRRAVTEGLGMRIEP
ncbi:MAG TPA: 4-phosphoerythronate dehydrogenase [Rubricoccaceae bacterium]